ncbi:MAG TPA: hypothetical protein VHE13_03725 [Opitutus sp.]|nr:hypothetical protein [Opitutus sp.]
MKKRFPFPLLFAAQVALAAAPAQDTTNPPVPPPTAAIKLGTGFDYSSGDYGFSQNTEVFAIPVNFAYEEQRWALRATWPFLTIKGPATIVAGSATSSPGTTSTGAPGRPVTGSESGLGDLQVSATYHFHPVPGELNFDLTGRLKLPTADEDKGLGTGKTDFYAQADIYQAFDRFVPFATLGYRFLGRSTFYPLKDGPYTSAGVSYRMTATTVVGGAFDWRSKIVVGAQDATDALGFVSTNLSDRLNLLGYALVGFNEAAPDYGLGGSVTYKF